MLPSLLPASSSSALLSTALFTRSMSCARRAASVLPLALSVTGATSSPSRSFSNTAFRAFSSARAFPAFRASAAASTSASYCFSRLASSLSTLSVLFICSSFFIAATASSLSPLWMALYSRSYCPVAEEGAELKLNPSPLPMACASSQ